jgi:hypothetical protein
MKIGTRDMKNGTRDTGHGTWDMGYGTRFVFMQFFLFYPAFQHKVLSDFSCSHIYQVDGIIHG